MAVGCGRDAPPEPTGPLLQRTAVRGPVDLAVIGDFGTGEEAQREVAEALRTWADGRPLDALVTTGDNIYDSGHPDEFDQAWHQPYGWVDREGIPVLASLGNHDAETGGGAPVMELLSMPGPWYAHRLGPVELFVLDGNHLEDPAQLSFVGSALRRSAAPWKVAVVHHPPYTCGHHDGHGEIRERWLPVFRAGGVDLVLSGHDHNYQRFPRLGDVVFVVSGGGGQDLDDVDECPAGTPDPVFALDDRHHFVTVRATRETLRLRAVAVPGSEVVDEVILRR
ncbi:MAG: metallophosphoesterase family protein [Actinomycetota bacterium]